MIAVIIALGLFLSSPASLSQVVAERVAFPENNEINPIHQHTNQKYYLTKRPGDTPENAPDIFIPIESSANDGHNTKGDDFRSSLITGSEARTLIAINLDIFLNGNNNNRDLFIAGQEESGDNYRIAYNFFPIYETTKQITFDLKTLCDVSSQLKWDCLAFQNNNPDTEEILLFISVGATGSVNAGTSINPKSYNGVYLKLKLSSIVQTQAPTLEKLYKGENRIRVSYTGAGVQEPLGNYALRKEQAGVSKDTACSNFKPNEAVYGDLSIDEEDVFELNANGNSSLDFVRGLQNNRCYTIQVFYQDKYYFASKISSGLSTIPEDIEELLKKHTCFLFTAGFRGDHPIVHSFRHYRDNVLAHNPAGKWFIRKYYQYAPSYAPLILRYTWLSMVVRGLAHIFYFFLNYGKTLLWVLAISCLMVWTVLKSYPFYRKTNGRA